MQWAFFAPLSLCLPTTCSIREMIIICHDKLWDSCRPLSRRLTRATFGVNLDPDWATSFLTMLHEGGGKKKALRSNHLKTHAHTHTLRMSVSSVLLWRACALYISPIPNHSFSPLNTSRSRWLHPVLGRKGHTIKWLRPSVHVTEWWCITPGWLYVYLTHCEHEYDFRDH